MLTFLPEVSTGVVCVKRWLSLFFCAFFFFGSSGFGVVCGGLNPEPNPAHLLIHLIADLYSLNHVFA